MYKERRDAMLAATGELNRTLGGIPNRPEINLEAALQPRQVMGTFASGLDILALQCPPVEVGKQGGQAGFLQECRRFLGYLQSAFPD